MNDDAAKEFLREWIETNVQRLQEFGFPPTYQMPLIIPRELWDRYGDELKTLYPDQFEFRVVDNP